MDSSTDVLEFDSLEQLIESVHFADLIEFERNGETKFGYYIGDGEVILKTPILQDKSKKESESLIESDGTPRHVVDYAQPVAWQEAETQKKKNIINDFKFKIIERQPWKSRLKDGVVKEFDIIQVESHQFIPGLKMGRICHFALATTGGNGVDLNPTSPIWNIGSKPANTERQAQSEAVNSVDSNAKSKSKTHGSRKLNGIIQERSLREIIAGQRYRIISDDVMIRLLSNDIEHIKQHPLKPLDVNEIRKRVAEALTSPDAYYNLLTHNCEHFVMYLKFGAWVSSQANRLKLLAS